jgi:FAD/FMN-containing dehydrogenase
MSGMDNIIAIHGASPLFNSAFPAVDLRNPVLLEEDSDLVCQPGVGWTEINETLKEKGIPLFFPVRAIGRRRR